MLNIVKILFCIFGGFMLQNVYKSLKTNSEKAVESLIHSLGKLRTGRANSGMLDDIRVDYYGTMTLLSQIANISVPEARMIVIKPWEKPMLTKIEKAIQASDLGINPVNNGEMIMLTVPALTEERRKDLVKSAKKYGEEFKQSLRTHRHDALDLLKSLEKDKSVTEDEAKKGKDKIQEILNDYIKKIDDIIKAKEDEIMKV